MKKPCVRLKIWDKVMKWVEFVKCLEFWVENLNLCLAVIASEQSERGNPKSKNNAKFMDCHAVFAKTARNDAFAVILSISEVSKNGKFSFNLCGFFATLKMTKWAIFAKTARNDERKKSKNKVFKNFNVLKSASNEREREREKSPTQTLPHFCFI